MRTSRRWSNRMFKRRSGTYYIWKTISIEKYIDKIRPYLKDIIKYRKKSDTWEIQLTITINFLSYKDTDEKFVMHSKSDNLEIMIIDKAVEVLEEIFQSLLPRYQNGL